MGPRYWVPLAMTLAVKYLVVHKVIGAVRTMQGQTPVSAATGCR